MILSLAWDQGSGKSTVGKLLADRLGYHRYSTGDFFRQIATERGVSILEINQIGETDGGVLDRIIDDRQKKLGETDDDFVIDGRLAFHFIPQSFKVYMKVEPHVGAERIYGDTSELRMATDRHETLERVVEQTQARRASEAKRYQEYYGIDHMDMSLYDTIVDTTTATPEEVCETILRALHARSGK